MTATCGKVLVAGAARGPALRLTRPISFWGGIDPNTGRVSDPRHPEHGVAVAGAILMLPGAIGSSSSSAVMLELLRNGRAPAAVVLGEPDTILALGVVVARELGYPTIPVLECALQLLAHVPAGGELEIVTDGTIRHRA